MAKYLAFFVLVLSLLLPIVAPATASATTPSKASAVRCEEDMPCWDCKTMGNKICGPIVAFDPVADAWESFYRVADTPKYAGKCAHAYKKTLHKFPRVGPNSIVVKSYSRLGTWHVFSYKKCL